MTGPADPLWDDAPCGLLVLRRDGSVLQVNRTLLDWTGLAADDVEGQVRLGSLLTVGGRIYWETHLAPLLHVEGRLDEVAVELRVPDGRLPVLLSAVVRGPAEQVHVAVSSARGRSHYERELLAARTAADRSSTRLQALQATTADLSRALGVTAVADALLAAAVGPLGAASATLWTTDEDDALLATAARGEELDAPRTPPVTTEQGSAPSEHDGRVVVPLHGRSGLRGLLSLAPRTEPAADPVDVDLLTAVAQQGGLALDRARLYEQSAGVAHELQHSLLAVDPPADHRFAVATAYRPGVEMLEVGGDWHDVFLVREGLLAVVVGDVVGRGLRAASAMGQLRSAVRAVAEPGLGPARLLERLDRFVEQVDAAAMATLVYAELELATGRVRYACAGHPPPLLLPADGDARLLWDGRSSPLGGFVRPAARPEAEVVLSPGDRVLLCTDGLFERKERDLDVGLDLLTAAAAPLGPLPLEEAVASLTATLLRDESSRDDVCVLLLSFVGEQFERHLRADLLELSRTRHELSAWLRGCGVPRSDRDDVVLAASEAVANAAEHGAGLRRDAWVSLRARVDEHADVVLVVEDSGRWRSPSSSHERGRGLAIMRAVMDDVQVLQNEQGTRAVLRKRSRVEVPS